MMRTIVTEKSRWEFNLDTKMYLRTSVTDTPNGWPEYTDEWEPFLEIEPHGDRVIVHRPVPFGTGALRCTGPILSDTLDEGE